MSKLWPHQVTALELVRREYKLAKKWACVVMPTGAGKTRFGGEVFVQHHGKSPSTKKLWIAHREELVSQAYDALTELGLPCGVIQANPTREVNPHRPVQIASVQTLVARGLVVSNVSLFGYDECFVAGTLVSGRPIEELGVGDKVQAVDHDTGSVCNCQITRTSRRPATKLVRVNGTVCTPEHPFFVPGVGYVNAKDLKGHWIVRRMRQEYPLRYRTPAFYTGWEWNATAESSVEPFPGDFRVSNRICSGYWKGCSGSWSREQLQNRHSPTDTPTGHRDRRWFSLYSGPAGARPEEGSFFAVERVDSVEVLEPGSDGTFGGLCPDGHVYNLEVEEHHNYFANGILVHNCHHGASDTWSKVALQYKTTGCFGLGLTATPIRADNKPLGDIFDSLVCPITMHELIEQGFLVPYELIRPRHALQTNQLAQSPVDAYKKHALGRQAIVFAANVLSARLFKEQFLAAGIPCDTVTGEMGTGDRRSVLDKYRTGVINVLVNCSVLTEGFDDRPTSCVILARSVGSIALYLQMCGRALRTSLKSGKTNAILIDLYGSSHNHNEPASDREWTLDGDGIKHTNQPPVPERFCSACGLQLEGNATICTECGRPSSVIVPPDVVNAELIKFAWMRKKSPEDRVACLRRWLGDAKSLKQKEGRAMHKYRSVFGDWPPYDIVRQARAKAN